MRTLLGFHFRDDIHRKRDEIFRRVRPIVEGLYPWDEVIVSDSGHDPYNRAATRNIIAKYAEDNSYDVVVICDADSIPQPNPLRFAIIEAYHNTQLSIPFNKVKVLPVNNFFVRPHRYERIKPLYEYGESCGGIYVTSPSTWRLLGGMDERIIGWGFEDQIILASANTFIGGPTFIPGSLYNVNHPRDSSSLKIESNDLLIRKYHAAEGKTDEFRAIQVGSNRFFV